LPSLPVPLTPILGRQRELDEAAALLAQTRLLTLTGAGGSGKTRLALELAERDAREVAWIDLAPIQDESLIPQQILSAIELHEPPARDLMPAILDALKDLEILLVFDNCEHVVDRVAAIAASILTNCEHVAVVATTREALGITGETTWLVPPLQQSEAIQLFAERAKAVLPIFAIEPHNADDVARICARLDGIPLAIELAAARAKVLSIRQIAERLNDAFSLLSGGSGTLPPHRTIRATIDWSWRLISEEEQVVFRRLAVFAGSFSVAAVEAIAGHLDLIASLVDKSLAICERSADKARYRLLDTVRQFAGEKLDEAGERDAIRERHATFYLQLAEQMEPRLFAGASDPEAMEQIDDEIANLRAVFDSDHATQEIQMRLVYALHWYWFARGQFHEARERATRSLAGAPAGPLRSKAQIAAGHAAVWQGDLAAIDVDIEPLRDDLRALSTGLMLNAIAQKGSFDEAVAVARQHGGVALALVLYWAGLGAQVRGDRGEARAAFEEAHSIGLKHRSAPATAHPLTVIGWLNLYEGRRDDAMAAFRSALELHAQVDDRWGLTHVVEGIAFLVADEATSATLLAAAEGAWLQLGARPGRAKQFDTRREQIMKAALSDDYLRKAVASGAGMGYDEMVALARFASASPAAEDGGEPAGEDAGAPIEVRAFGHVDGGKTWELLLYLLMNPKGTTKEQIGAALWPDAPPQKVRNNFHVTLHRLRKVVGDRIVAGKEGYRFAGAADFDVAEFVRDPKANLHLYRGDFFENGSGEWIEEKRAELRDLYTSTLVEIGRSRLSTGDFTGAAQIYARLLTLDEYDEQAARQLMTCYGRLGDIASVTRVYRKLESDLKRGLGTAPDPVTTKIYQRVSAG
jgi:predicted ATPase/DNA-binding SARP family transcriptional activator